MSKFKSKKWTTFALAGTICFAHLSRALAQTADPAKEPTTAQARDFISSMVEQHSSSSCDKNGNAEVAKGPHETYDNSSLARIDGNRITIQQTQKKSSDTIVHKDTHRVYVMTVVATTTGLLSELGAEANTVTYHSQSDCGITHAVVLNCKTAGCLKEKTAYTHNGQNMIGQQYSGESEVENTTSGSVSVPINDSSIADRIVKALKFYQEHSPAAAASSF